MANAVMLTWRSACLEQRRLRVAGARFIGEQKLVKIGPRRRRNSPEPESKTLVPTTSEGMRSGVICTRRNSRPKQIASARTISVLATPGTPSSSTWPPASVATSISCSARC